MVEWLKFATTEGILSALLFLTVTWLLRWFTTTGWKDIQAERRERLAIERLQAETECDREMERIRAEIEIQRQTVLQLTELNRNLTDWFAEVRAISTIQSIQHNILLHIRRNSNVSETTSPPDIAS